MATKGKNRVRRFAIAIGSMASILAFRASITAAEEKFKETYTAFAMVTGNIATGAGHHRADDHHPMEHRR